MAKDSDNPFPTAQPLVQPHETLYPGGDAKKRKLAVHEGAHSVVADDVHCKVLSTNISVRNGRKRITRIRQPVDFLSRNQQDIARDQVTIFVAGLVAEKATDQTVELVSQQMTPELLAGIGADEPDVIMTANALRNARIASMGEITAVEDRARQILAKRQNHHEAVTDKLFELECLEGEVLDQALGKVPLQSADAGDVAAKS